MYSSYDLKDKYPYWWANKEREEREREMSIMLDMAKMEIEMFISQKMKDIENQINDIIIRIKTDIDGKPATIQAINDEIKKLLYDEMRRAFR